MPTISDREIFESYHNYYTNGRFHYQDKMRYMQDLKK